VFFFLLCTPPSYLFPLCRDLLLVPAEAAAWHAPFLRLSSSQHMLASCTRLVFSLDVSDSSFSLPSNSLSVGNLLPPSFDGPNLGFSFPPIVFSPRSRHQTSSLKILTFFSVFIFPPTFKAPLSIVVSESSLFASPFSFNRKL